ncbi:hypothetical protein [Pseudoponticoccus marisrubri]|uniref:Uncharacterized protein n=1 Tax=Pseudoponticoccus marisrubri TaxID=1685382 RepID=A0A0W7WM39_9RHOB|nr:hypothetical protein [Pseudoponticoccus marisrubri]KUF11556.1 hypothetical protein AVJ23_07295 [Pseudoponticoccus marisrubri]
MKKVLAGVFLAATALAAPAMAWESQVVACYDKVYVPPKYKTHKKLVMAAHYEWEHKHGQMVKVYYPAVYKEYRHKEHEGYYVARKAPCKH